MDAAHAWNPDDLAFPSSDEAKPETSNPVADAYALGFDEGRLDGEVAERTRLRTAVTAAQEALDVIRANEERWLDSIEENIVALSTAIARHIVDRELEIDPTVIDRLVARALGDFPIDQPVRIRVNPQDLVAIDTRAAILTDATTRVAHWLGDARIAPGGCVVEGRDRIIDGRVETALERVYRRLTHLGE